MRSDRWAKKIALVLTVVTLGVSNIPVGFAAAGIPEQDLVADLAVQEALSKAGLSSQLNGGEVKAQVLYPKIKVKYRESSVTSGYTKWVFGDSTSNETSQTQESKLTLNAEFKTQVSASAAAQEALKGEFNFGTGITVSSEKNVKVPPGRTVSIWARAATRTHRGTVTITYQQCFTPGSGCLTYMERTFPVTVVRPTAGNWKITETCARCRVQEPAN